MKKIKLLAPAKINLFLDIKGIRQDGYHQVEMIMQSIALYDQIIIQKTKKNIELSVSDKNIPDGEDNLAYQAAEIILNNSGIKAGAKITLKKNIPVAAGLAGGSTDAAAVLKGINKLYDLQLSYTSLKKMAAKLGADVPFCLKGGTVLATGKGDQLEQLPDIKKTNILLVRPQIEVSTARIYKEYDRIKPEMQIPGSRLIKLVNNRNNILWNEGWNNILEPVTAKLFPEILEIKNILYDFDLEFALMSGSGPTIFAIVETVAKGKNIIKKWPRKKDFLYLTTTINKDQSIS